MPAQIFKSVIIIAFYAFVNSFTNIDGVMVSLPMFLVQEFIACLLLCLRAKRAPVLPRRPLLFDNREFHLPGIVR